MPTVSHVEYRLKSLLGPRTLKMFLATTIRQSDVAMGNGPSIDDFPVKTSMHKPRSSARGCTCAHYSDSYSDFCGYNNARKVKTLIKLKKTIAFVAQFVTPLVGLRSLNFLSATHPSSQKGLRNVTYPL